MVYNSSFKMPTVSAKKTFIKMSKCSASLKNAGGFKYVSFSPQNLGEMIQFDEHMCFKGLVFTPPTRWAFLIFQLQRGPSPRKGRSIAKWSGSLFDPFRTKQFHGVALAHFKI